MTLFCPICLYDNCQCGVPPNERWVAMVLEIAKKYEKSPLGKASECKKPK